MERSRIIVLIAGLLALALGFVVLSSRETTAPDGAIRGAEVEAPVAAPKPGSAISGQVVAPDGTPIPGAKVWLVEREGSAITGPDGRFRIEGVRTGKYMLAAQAEGFVLPGPPSLHAREVAIGGKTPLSGVVLTLHKPATIMGRVVAGEQAVSARLSLIYLDAEGLGGYTGEFSLDGVATTAANGTFRIENVAPGRVRVLAEPESHALGESRLLSLEDDETKSGVVIDLMPGGGLVGTVHGPEGEAVATAEILISSSAMPRSRRDLAESDGSFDIAHLPEGPVRIEIRANGYRTEVLEEVVVTSAGKQEELNIVLERSSGIYGRVVDAASGKGISPAFVVYPGRRGRTPTEKDGAFMWAKAPEDIETIQAVSPFHSASRAVAPRRDGENLFELGPGGWVDGRVVDSQGSPVTNFTVVVESFDVEGPAPYGNRVYQPLQVSHSRGAFRFGPLRPGSYDFRARANGFADGTSARADVRPGATKIGVEIRLQAGASLKGSVKSADGTPLARARVELFDPLSPFRADATLTDDAGNFRLDGITPGRRSIRVGAKGYLTAVEAGINVEAGAEPERRDVVLTPKTPGEAFTFAGIGASLRKSDEGAVIDEIFAGQPAELYGLSKGDLIVAVDGERTRDMRLDKIIEMIRGQEGVQVELEIDRESEGRMVIEVERGRVVVKESRGNRRR